MQNLKRGAFAALIGLAVATPLNAADNKVLNIFNWSDYVAPNTIADFEKATGIKVNYDVFDSNEILEAKLLAGRSNYDIVVPTASFLERQAKAGIFRPLDKSKLENYKNLDAELLARIAQNDPKNTFAIPYMWGTIGIGYNKDKIKERLGVDTITSWDVLFKPEMSAKLKDCGIAVLDSPSEAIGTALGYLGIDPNSEKPEDLAKGTDLMKQLRPNVKYFHSSQYINDLATGAICAVVGYNGDILQARTRAEEAKNGVSIGFSVPQEGGLMWFDVMAIPKDAPHAENAHIFLNYILKPEVTAAISDKVHYANASTAATPLVSPEVRNDPGTYPSAAVRSKLFTMKAHSAKFDRLLTRAWTEMKTGK
ncbi:polyamine ABC transporter substrate-binding protein [Microvirga alba]|uniref:Putrescine-binding periplasmic protein n=1 Tax=Microvirga alba TaxID=2791025 RepID=A0A931BN87_9HYPH|nr:polyamine ABC transporter substrate-binding protein [Microvirga alba]MBF9232599.1 polyamine ABC transporter substrate-binding protein [Microvirga alba]